MGIVLEDRIHQRFHQIIEIRFSLMRLAVALKAFLFAPALWHRKDKSDVRVCLRQFDAQQPYVIAECAVSGRYVRTSPFSCRHLLEMRHTKKAGLDEGQTGVF